MARCWRFTTYQCVLRFECYQRMMPLLEPCCSPHRALPTSNWRPRPSNGTCEKGDQSIRIYTLGPRPAKTSPVLVATKDFSFSLGSFTGLCLSWFGCAYCFPGTAGSNGSLWFDQCDRVVTERPRVRAPVFENVPGLIRKQHRADFESAVAIFKEAGYAKASKLCSLSLRTCCTYVS